MYRELTISDLDRVIAVAERRLDESMDSWARTMYALTLGEIASVVRCCNAMSVRATERAQYIDRLADTHARIA